MDTLICIFTYLLICFIIGYISFKYGKHKSRTRWKRVVKKPR